MMNRKIKSSDVATALLKLAPQSCSIYVIMKDNVHTVRHAKYSPTLQTSMTDPGPDAADSTKYSSTGWSAQTISPDTYDVTRY